MKKNCSISLIALAVLMVLAPTVVSHHHHDGGAACLVMEYCGKDNSINDEHTGHSENGTHHDGSCIIEADFVVSQSDNGTRCKASSCDDPDHVHFFPIPYIAGDILTSTEETVSPDDYGEPVSFYTSAEASRFHGLRAPPFSLS